MPLSRINAQSLTDGTIVASEIADGTITGTKLATNLDLSDSQTIRFGTDNDASITHDGTNLIIDSNNGTTLYHAGQHFFKNQFGTEDHARFSSNGAVNLYHDNAEKFRTTSTGIQVFGTISSSVGDLTMSDGNVVFASGHGIDFSATADASGMSGELLDDYEEGSWTPALTGVSSHSVAVARYVKVGNIVTAHAHVNGVVSGSGTMTCSGLPYASNSATNMQQSITVGFHSHVFYSSGSMQGVQCRLNPSSSEFQFLRYRHGNNGDGLQASQQSSTAVTILVGGTYITD